MTDRSNILVLNDFKISDFQLEFSFVFKTRQTGGSKSIESLGPLAYMKKTGFSLINVDEAVIRMKKLQFKRKVVSQDELGAALGRIYKENFISEMKKIMLSVGILGSPRNFYLKMHRGTMDLYHKPKDGFAEHGLLAGFRGFGAGTISFSKNLSIGLVSSVSTLLRSFSQLVLTVTTDRDYAKMREDNYLTERPKDFVEGVGYGSSALKHGIISGVTGIFTRPYIMTRRQKGIGFAKGVY